MYDLVFDQILPYMIKCLSQGLHSLNLGCTLCYFTRLLFWEKNICHNGCIGMVYHLCVFTDVLPYPYLSTHVLQWNGLSPLWMHCCITETCIWANKIQWVIYYGFSQECTLCCHTICFFKMIHLWRLLHKYVSLQYLFSAMWLDCLFITSLA